MVVGGHHQEGEVQLCGHHKLLPCLLQVCPDEQRIRRVHGGCQCGLAQGCCQPAALATCSLVQAGVHGRQEEGAPEGGVSGGARQAKGEGPRLAKF